MQPDEIERSTDAAQDYLNKQMQPADLVSVVSLANTLTVNQDFTSDRDKLKQVLHSFNAGANAGFELVRPARPKALPTPPSPSRSTTPSTTSSTPTAAWKPCARLPTRSPTFLRRSR